MDEFHGVVFQLWPHDLSVCETLAALLSRLLAPHFIKTWLTNCLITEKGPECLMIENQLISP